MLKKISNQRVIDEILHNYAILNFQEDLSVDDKIKSRNRLVEMLYDIFDSDLPQIHYLYGQFKINFSIEKTKNNQFQLKIHD